MRNTILYPLLKAGIVIWAICAFGACKKDQAGLSYQLSTDALAYIQLTPGKYFIYKDSVAGNTDSVVVTQSQLSVYKGTILGANYTGQQFSLVLTQNFGGATAVWLSGTSPGSLMTRVQLIDDNNQQNVIFKDITTILPTMVVEGKTYTNVSLSENGYGAAGTAGSFRSSYYWVKGVGLIRRSETNGSVTKTYTLLRSN